MTPNQRIAQRARIERERIGTIRLMARIETFVAAMLLVACSKRAAPAAIDPEDAGPPVLSAPLSSASAMPPRFRDEHETCRFGCAGDEEFNSYPILLPPDPGAAKITVEIGTPVLSGPGHLSSASVASALKAIVPRLRRCRVFGTNGTFQEPATVEVSFGIGDLGDVTERAKEGGHSVVPNPNISACVRRQVNGLTFRKPHGAKVEVFVRISFAAK